MIVVSASLFGGFRFLWGSRRSKRMTFTHRAFDWVWWGCAEVRLSRTARARDRLVSFQLESLILAQNERWRQA